MAENYALKHQVMVRDQLIRRGIDDQRVLDAFTRVKRHQYVPEDKRPNAYEDYPLAIGANQTISQPYVVAYILAKLVLNGTERVLEIGTGSGYQTALLAELSAQVYRIEFVPELAVQARQILTKTGYHNIAIRIGNGREGWPEAMPFDAVVASAAHRQGGLGRRHHQTQIQSYSPRDPTWCSLPSVYLGAARCACLRAVLLPPLLLAL